MVGEFERRGARSAFRAVDHDEVGQDAGLQHRLGDTEKFPGVADAQFEAGRFAARQRAQPLDEFEQFARRREGRMARRRDAVLTHSHAARCGDLGGDLGGRQHAAMARFGALRQLDLDHLDLSLARLGCEFVGVETSVCVAATEIARRHFPDDVAAVFTVIWRDRTFAGIVGEAAFLRAQIQCADRVGRQRAEAHRRDIEERHRIGLRARRADHHAEVVMRERGRCERVADPFVIDRFHIQFGAERPTVRLVFRALVDDAALLARERLFVGIAFDEILADFGTNELEDKAEVSPQRIVAQDRMRGLGQIAQPVQNQCRRYDEPKRIEFVQCGEHGA